VRVAPAIVFGLSLAGCSPSADDPGGEADAALTDASTDASTDAAVACLVCGDATEELPDWVRVKGEVVRVCSNSDNCHGSGAGGMGLSPGHEFDTMIDVTSFENPPMKRVLPGDPAQSYVYLKLACDGGIYGACMPNGATFDPQLARLFHDWIEAGAPTQ
jgi:hypothetical protein